MTRAQHNCKPPWTPHTLAVTKAARGRFTRCPCTRRLSACHGATERVQSGRRAPTPKAVRRAATTCSEEMTSCDHVDSWRNTLLRRPSSSAGAWAGRKRRVAADRAHWPPGAAGEAPDGVHSSRTSAFQFGAITPQAPPRSGGLWCDLYSGQKAQLSLSMNKTDDILWLDAGAVMGHCAPCVWHWFHAIYHLF